MIDIDCQTQKVIFQGFTNGRLRTRKLSLKRKPVIEKIVSEIREIAFNTCPQNTSLSAGGDLPFIEVNTQIEPIEEPKIQSGPEPSLAWPGRLPASIQPGSEVDQRWWHRAWVMVNTRVHKFFRNQLVSYAYKLNQVITETPNGYPWKAIVIGLKSGDNKVIFLTSEGLAIGPSSKEIEKIIDPFELFFGCHDKVKDKVEATLASALGLATA